MGVGVAGVANYTNTSSGTASNVVAYGGIGGPYEYVSFFSVLNWFLKGEPGAWYDPSDLTTLFQDSAGTIPVTAVEQPVGLMLDKSGRGNHAFQATPGNRPMLSARVNLLTKTEDFSDAIWSVLGSVAKTNNYTSAPDGTLTAGRIVFASNSSAHQFFQYQATTAISYTQKVWLKVPSGTGSIIFGFYDGGIKTSSIPLTAQWQQFSFSTTTVVNAGSRSIWLYPDSSAGMATEIHIWHPGLRPTNAGALLPAYQRVNTASDYDTVGFPLYLKANGTSSAMSTNSIDFSSTDKMTVVTGVRKLSDAAKSYLIELSATSDTNNGSFALTAPNSAATNYAWLSKGTTADTLIATTYTAPLNNIITGLANISGATNTIRVNGIASSDTNTQGAGAYGNHPLYLFTRSATLPTVAYNFYGAIIRGAQSDTASVTQTENYMATKTGITF